MKNRDWINKQCIYDLLCSINEELDVVHCIISKLTGTVDSRRCLVYNPCEKKPNTDECRRYTCGIHCKSFIPNCKQCIMDYLNEEHIFKRKVI